MNSYAQFFDKYTERTVNINGVAYQANLVNAVTNYLKSNGYQVTNNSIASGCNAIIKQFRTDSTSITADYGKDNNNTIRVNNALATVFPQKQNTAQQPQTQPPQNPEGDGSKNPGDNPPQDDPINDLAGISMLTKDELRAMVNNGPLSKIMASLMKGKISVDFEGEKLKNPVTLGKNVAKSVKNTVDKVSSWAKDSASKGVHPNIKISNIQITGTDNIYDNEDNTNSKSRKSYNKQQAKSNKVKQGNQNGQVKA